VTSVVGVQKDLFSLWRGDLLITSLRARTLFRIRIEKQRAAYVESVIDVGQAIRDLVEGVDGRIALLLQGGGIGLLEPILSADNPEQSTNDPTPFSLVLAQCEGCHAIGDGTNHGVGPDLRGVVGRRIASAAGYEYSAALKSLSGRWTPEELDRFLFEPAAYAPGTSMRSGLLPGDDLRKKLIDYLANYKQ
jgi:cytochrome c2